MDLDDPLEGGPCYQLYSTEFYAMIKAKLKPGGIFVTQVAIERGRAELAPQSAHKEARGTCMTAERWDGCLFWCD